MALATPFLGDARGRLLPAAIPFRFFGAAVFFHLLAWLMLLAGAAQAPGFAGGPGLPLSALHMLTLGVLVMTAIGASLQLLPVATRQAVGSPRLLAALWWSYTPGVAALTMAMALGQLDWLVVAAAALVLVLAGYAWLLGRNLAQARGMPIVVVHGWAALLCLLGLLTSGLSLAADYQGQGVIDHVAALGLHVSLAAYGFMGLLVLGLSYILLPMFALADPPAARPSLASAALVIAGLALAVLAGVGGVSAWGWTVALLFGLAGLALHVALMSGVLRSGMRRQLGRPFVLVRLGWAALAASLLAALALEAGAGFERLRTLFVVLLVGGLLSFLLGVLSRIVPFLASMHAPVGRRGPPLPSAMTADKALAVHFGCHCAAFALLLLAVLADSAWLARTAGLLGSAGGVAFGWFFIHAWRRMRAAPAAAVARTPQAKNK
jgi:hypothetical protein